MRKIHPVKFAASVVGVVMVIFLSLVIVFYGAIGCAVYWGLSLAERAVDNAAPTTHQTIVDE